MMKCMKSIVVIYHANCPDGFTAAWAAWKKFGAKADYYAVEPRALPDVPLVKKDIFVLDNSIRKENLAALAKKGNQVTVIDHHMSSEEDVKSAPNYVFDNAHSGAVLAWNHFHPDKPMPRFLKIVEDMDLWRFKVPFTRELNAVANLTKREFREWSKLAATIENTKKRKALIEQGKLLLRYNNELIRRLIENAYPVEFLGYKAYAVNTPFLQSEAGNALAETLAPVAILWYDRSGTRRYSLRSNGTVDVAALAARFGGGGHKAAAGFTLPIAKPFPWKTLPHHER